MALTIRGLEMVSGGPNSLPPIDPYEAQGAKQLGDGSAVFDRVVVTDTDVYVRIKDSGHWMRVRPHLHDELDADETE